jgi:hypothetical protein
MTAHQAAFDGAPVKDTGEGAETSAPLVSVASHRESDDDYRSVVARLNDRWRVIDSGEPHPYRQWILQYRKSMKRPNRWSAEPPFGSFCQTRAVLLRCIREKARTVDPAALAVIEALPERIG